MAIDPAYAEYLQSDGLYAQSTVAGAAAAWGDKAVDSKIMSPIAIKAAAQAEADRQAAFLAGPIVKDVHTVRGQRVDLLGKLVTIDNPRLGYAGGALAFVIEAAEATDKSVTTLTVLKRLTG